MDECLVKCIELYNPHLKSTVEVMCGDKFDFIIDDYLYTNFETRKISKYKFKNLINSYVYRIPFTCVYIDKDLKLWAREEDIKNNNLLFIPVLDDAIYEIKMIELNKAMLKCTTIYNAKDNFLNMGFNLEQLYHIAKYCKLEEYLDIIIDAIRNETDDNYEKHTGYNDSWIAFLVNNVKNNMIIEDNISYLEKSIYVSLSNDRISIEFNFEGNENIPDNHIGKLFNGSSIVLSHGDSKYTLFIYTSNGKYVEKYDLSKNEGSLIHTHNLFKTIVPGWKPGKDYESLFCSKLPDNINKIIWK